MTFYFQIPMEEERSTPQSQQEWSGMCWNHREESDSSGTIHGPFGCIQYSGYQYSTGKKPNRVIKIFFSSEKPKKIQFLMGLTVIELREQMSNEFAIMRTLEACLNIIRKRVRFKFTWNNTILNVTPYHWSAEILKYRTKQIWK